VAFPRSSCVFEIRVRWLGDVDACFRAHLLVVVYVFDVIVRVAVAVVEVDLEVGEFVYHVVEDQCCERYRAVCEVVDGIG